MTLEAYLQSLRDKKVAVFGLGVSNRPLVRLLAAHGIDVTGCDRMEQPDENLLELQSLDAKLKLGSGYLDGVEADVVFRTPGMRPDAPALQRLRDAGARITSEMAAFFAVCPCPIIAVTGSDGKTTTTTLIAELLRRAGRRVWVGGNIGRPLLPEAERIAPDDLAVLELSSFQLMDLDASPHVAVVTNLAPNHLDVHRDMAEYVSAKENIFLHQKPGDVLVLNLDNEITESFGAKAVGEVRYFSRQDRPARGVYLRDDVIWRDDMPVLTRADIRIPGLHNVENYMAAICAVEGLVPDDDIRAVARTFAGVEHRIELVREKDGVKFYNDSIASSPTRTIAGLRSFDQKVILIAGGYDKHIPYDTLGPEIVEHVRALVLTGATAPNIREAVVHAPRYRQGSPELLEADSFEQAVRLAAAIAHPGDVVLLSPASASFDCFRNFMERGDAFKRLVQEL